MSGPAAKRTTRLVLAGLCLGLFGVLTALVATTWSPLIRLDDRVGQWPHDETLRHHWLERTARVVAAISQPDVLLVTAVVLAIVLAWKGHRRAAIWTAGVMVVARASELVLKRLIQRDRPHWADPIQVFHSYSFPSSHATSIAAAAGVLITLGLMLLRKRAVRHVLVTLALLAVLLVSADRLFLGVHHASDVVAGWLLGAGLVLLGLVVFNPIPRSIALTADPLPEVFIGVERRLAVVDRKSVV